MIDVNFNGDPGIYDQIRENLKDLNIGVLINAVDTNNGPAGYFHKISDNRNAFQKVLHCNVGTMINLCYIVLPNMIKNGKGVIINVSSIFASASSPFFTLYGASKVHKMKFNFIQSKADFFIYYISSTN